MKLNRKQYSDLYKKLPPEVFDLVMSGETTEKLYKIAEKHKLHIDDAGIMHDIVMDTAMGVISSKNMELELVKELKLNPLDARVIARDVDEQIFAPIKELMIKTYNHGNPFKPQTMLHTDENDEEELNRDHLLAEIENPTKSIVKKETTGLPKTPEVNTAEETPAAPAADAVPQLDDTLLKSRERMLSAITDQKLSGIVAMSHFTTTESSSLPKGYPSEPDMKAALEKPLVSKEETKLPKEVVPTVAAPTAPPPKGYPSEPSKATAPKIEPRPSSIADMKAQLNAPVLEQKAKLPESIIVSRPDPVIAAAPMQNEVAAKPAADPYRESLI